MVTTSTQPPTSPSGVAGRRSCLTTLLAFVGGAAAVIVAMLLIVRASQNTMWSLFRETTRIDLSQPTVVDRIQKLQRLETVVYTMDKIVTGEKQNSILPSFLAGDRLLLLVHGEVIAGIDFQTLKPADVQVNGQKVRVKLPQAEVLVAKLDSGKTKVYSRQTGLLVATDPNLESQVRQDAEADLRRSALADGILQKAQENARSTITSLMQGMGFTAVEFE